MATQWKEQLIKDAFLLTIEEQYCFAAKLAANCGCQLVAEDTERSLEIRNLKSKIDRGYGGLPAEDRQLLIQGLEALLK